MNEKTGLLGQRVVTSQIKEQYPPSPTRDLYRALSPAYSPIAHDLEWQDEFEFGCGPHDSGLKKILMPHLQILQKHLTQEFGEIEKGDAKRIFSENKVGMPCVCALVRYSLQSTFMLEPFLANKVTLSYFSPSWEIMWHHHAQVPSRN